MSEQERIEAADGIKRIRLQISAADWSGLAAAAERMGRSGRQFASAAAGLHWRNRLTAEQLAQLGREEARGTTP